MQNPVDSIARRRNVTNSLASLNIEKLKPGVAVKRDLDAYVAGRKTITAVIDAVLRRHVPLRRT